MLKPGAILFIFAALAFSCRQHPKALSDDAFNTVYDVGAIPGVDTFKVYNAMEKRMDEGTKQTERMADSLLEKELRKKTSEKSVGTRQSYFFYNRSRITMKTFENGKLTPKDKPFDQSAPAVCACQLKGDSILVQTAAGFFGGFGFNIKLHRDNFDLYYFEYIDGDYLKANPNDTAFGREVMVKSRYQSLILDSKPTFARGQRLTGLAIYTSEKYYARGLGNAVDTTYVKGKFYFTCQVH